MNSFPSTGSAWFWYKYNELMINILSSYIHTRAQQLLKWATVWPQHTWAEKLGGSCCAPFHGGAGFPSNTMSPEPRPTSIPSGILIHPTIWPQYTSFTERQTGHPSRSTGWTVMCNCHPKTWQNTWEINSCEILTSASLNNLSFTLIKHEKLV